MPSGSKEETFTLGGKICKYISPYKKLSYYRRLWRWGKNKRKKDKIHLNLASWM